MYRIASRTLFTLLCTMILTACGNSGNQLQGGNGPIKILGDLNGDGVVDARDQKILVEAFGSKQGEGAFVAAADLDANGKIDLEDAKAFHTYFSWSEHYGDFDFDGDIDYADFNLFRDSFGALNGDARYRVLCDVELNGANGISDFGAFRTRLSAVGRRYGDFDGDGTVGAADLDVFNGTLGKRKGEAGYLLEADYDNNGIIDAADKAEFDLEFGH